MCAAFVSRRHGLCMYIYIYIYICTHIYTHTHIHVHVHIHTHTHVCTYIHIGVDTHVCMYICICMYIYIYIERERYTCGHMRIWHRICIQHARKHRDSCSFMLHYTYEYTHSHACPSYAYECAHDMCSAQRMYMLHRCASYTNMRCVSCVCVCVPCVILIHTLLTHPAWCWF